MFNFKIFIMPYIFATILALCFAAFIVMFSNQKIYCRLFERKDWALWEKILANFDTAENLGHNTWPDHPEVENYKFQVTCEEKQYMLIYWAVKGVCSVHIDEDCVLSDFDRYHSDMAVKMVKDKLGL